MKTITLTIFVSFLVLSGLALASQSAEQKQDPSMMEHMMMEGESKKSGGHMMRMMKMMDQCAAMMESNHDQDEKAIESQNK